MSDAPKVEISVAHIPKLINWTATPEVNKYTLVCESLVTLIDAFHWWAHQDGVPVERVESINLTKPNDASPTYTLEVSVLVEETTNAKSLPELRPAPTCG